MTFWKVDYLSSEDNTTLTRWFRNSRDAESFCDSLPGSIYSTNYYCREVVIPNNVLLQLNGSGKPRQLPRLFRRFLPRWKIGYRLAS